MIRYNNILSCINELFVSHYGTLTHPMGGSVNFTSTTYDSQARYICNTDYSLVGSETRICQFRNTWSDAVPICLKKGNKMESIWINR